MDFTRIGDSLAETASLDPTSDVIRGAVIGALDALPPSVEAALHGEGLGHALHPALVALPIGSFTAALALDGLSIVKRDESLSRGADAALGFGLIAALPAIAAGLADWARLDDVGTRRVGVVHLAANVAALSILGAAYVARKAGHRKWGRFAAVAGFVALNVGGYLGGVMATERGAGYGKR